MEEPETRYATVGEADVAYQVVGEGPFRSPLFLWRGQSHGTFSELPPTAEFLARLASFSRLILFDRRGTGASDGVPRNAIPTWEEWTEEVEAVLDAAGSKRTAIFAAGDGGPIAILFAAMHPERVRALVLLNTLARSLEADDYPIPNRRGRYWRETSVTLARPEPPAKYATNDCASQGNVQ